MSTASKRKITLMLDAEVYEGLRKRVGSRGIGSYLSSLAKPYVVETTIEDGYKAMALDEARNKEAAEWDMGVTEEVDSDNDWQF